MSRTDALSAKLRPQLQVVRQRWQQLSPRERMLLQAGGGVLLLALLWLLAIAPALQTLREAPQRKADLDRQLIQMRHLQEQAHALQQLPRVNPATREQLLTELSLRLLGPDSISVQAGQAQIQLRNVPPAALAEWLMQTRLLAHVLPQQAQLQRSATGWNGSLIVPLPAQEAAR